MLQNRALVWIRKRFAIRKIRTKLFIYIITITVVSIATLGILGSNMYRASIEKETNAHTTQMMNQVEMNIQQIINQMGDLIYYLDHNDIVTAFLQQSKPTQRVVEGVHEQFRIYESQHPSIAGMILVNKWNAYTSNNMTRISRDPLTQEAWYQQAKQQPEQIHLISHPIGRNIKTIKNYTADQVLAIVKALRDPLYNEVIGVLLIDMKLEVIQKVIESVSLGQSGFMYVMENSGGIVYSPVNPIVYRINDQWMAQGPDPFVKTINGRRFRIIANDFEQLHWKIVGVIPLDESLKPIRDLQLYTILIALITLFLALLASWFFTKAVTKPIAKLRSLMRRVEEGELHLRFPYDSDDEIGQLGKSYNNMVQEIENLINLVYEEQQKKREAELKILQAQIKPHFLYNTLDTIQWMAQDYGAQNIIEIIGALTQLFRIGLSKGSESIKVREELKHIKSYLYIQMVRYEGKLQYSIEAEENVMNLIVPKLILQPLVENAIYHGIKTKQGQGEIKISVVQQKDALFLYVQDNGIGMSPNKIEQLNEYFQAANPHRGEIGYGLFNVNERIKLSFGPEYGIRIANHQSDGITVIIKLPLNNI